ncbi:phosphoglucosamine mutase [Microlunatus endophyticus]|uniref:Phosphoglucosamine mutase n=1 Tax=Microlunatus endophyticus TaxID=1716077 RepID=A0A917SIH7_9ACTN|nr:phosphoglucosamine mutase [Microlunatus endophyticus]GGL82738.1 phosphoglucosamine mutase [Microlunatus endophyticus]
MGRLFGTDGVRGVANADLTADLALDLAVSAAQVLTDAGRSAGARPTALVGRDPRASGEFLEAAVVAGLASAGVQVVRLGVLPTPAVAHLTGAVGADFGVMISASHNPMPDNGIKFFARGGAKLEDSVEDAIEARLGAPGSRPTGAEVGRVVDRPELVDRYIDHLVGSIGRGRSTDALALAGIRVVVDCANGAAFRTAPESYRRLGAGVTVINAEPDGININDHCGSTHIAGLQQAVVSTGADLGIAVDGDADRCLAVDATGRVVDGDQIMAILAVGMHSDGQLPGATLVATVMSNLGLTQAMGRHGIRVEQTKVGDRYVLESMRAGGFGLGGEQSGHVVLAEHATTGDGVLTGLHLMHRMAVSGSSLGELAGVMERLPQVLVNVPNVDKTRTDSAPAVRDAVAAATAELGSSGRVLLRPSGTESLVRVMVEAPSVDQAQLLADRLAEVVRSSLALS